MSTKQKNKQKRLRTLLFVVIVLLPWLAIIGYIALVAKPRYVSTSSVVIKQVNNEQISAGGISALLGINTTSKEDALYLTEYILSNDMINYLDDNYKISEHYQLGQGDFIYQLASDASQEEKLRYFKKRINVELDELSSVLTVRTEGFSPEFALIINQAILAQSENFVNSLSRSVASEQMQFSEQQLKDAEERLAIAKKALLDYQNENQILDPATNAQIITQVISGLQQQLSSLHTEERQLLSYLNPDAPQIVAIRSQIRAVETQIKDEQSKLTSAADSKLNEQTLAFEAIKTDVAFADELYKLSLTAVEKARLEAIRKMKSLVVISSPHQAQEALYPRYGYVILTSLVFLLIVYGFVLLTISVIRDHSN